MLDFMRGYIKLGLVVALAAALSMPLSACGRKGAPEAPPGSTYPQNYPSY
ncbi:MAG: hypothetical protein KAQ66_00795 [Rhodospirillaceae bacterium]|nr:hypothetical protein [Rhodospirillaceae bacterium]MCK5546344.1 hypothetical protein [Rhodospirillaceae bacterium]